MRFVTKPEFLLQLGARLRRARLALDEPQARFAARLGVSVPTLRRMERGDATSQIGHWVAALDALDRLDDLNRLLETRPSLFDEATPARTRQRARRNP
jgi:transcriptional regulator with XRE-family HTH domain